MAKKEGNETPLMQQYYATKAKYPDAILLYRMGDFYETFGADAITTSRILGITLTKRSSGSPGTVELAGFPYHAIDTYLPKLVRAGHVLFCRQHGCIFPVRAAYEPVLLRQRNCSDRCTVPKNRGSVLHRHRNTVYALRLLQSGK